MIKRARSVRDDSKPAHPVLAYGCAIVVAGIVLIVVIVFTIAVRGIWGMSPQAVNALHTVAAR